MRRAATLATVGLVVVALWLGWRVLEFRRERSLAENGSRDALHAARAVDLAEPDPEAMPALSRAEVEESTEDEEAERETCLRGLILDARRETPLKGCRVLLSFGEQSLANATSDDDGRFVLWQSFPEGAELSLYPPSGWRIDDSRRELDGVPDGELVFLAHELPSGPVHGRVVDELTLEPVLYFPFSAGLEKLETDARGEFRGREPHPLGELQFNVMNWSYDLPWDPAVDAELVVPVRVGPVFFLATAPPSRWCAAFWLPEGALERHAFGMVELLRGLVEPGPPPRVRFDVRRRGAPVRGSLAWVDLEQHWCASATLRPESGSLALPLTLSEPRPIGLLDVSLATSRQLEWYEDIEVALVATSEGVREEAVLSKTGENALFSILEPGQCVVEARLDGETLGRAAVNTKLGESVAVELHVALPEYEEEAEPTEPTTPLSALVTSASGRFYGSQLRCTRITDGEELSAPVEWTRTNGRWEGRASDEGPAGEYRVALELDRYFPVFGPDRIALPASEPLVLHIDDSVAVTDVYLVPCGSDGAPLLVFEAEFWLDDGQIVGGEDFASPSHPVMKEYPRTLPFHWRAHAPGRRAAGGRWEPDGGEGPVRIEFPLERGWGAFLYVGGPNAEPLDGVQVFLDDSPAGTTAPDGQLALGSAERPERITLRYRDWRIEPDEGDVREDGTFDDSETSLSAYLAPPGR